MKIFSITNPQSKTVISKAIEYEMMSHLFKKCGEDEIVEAIYSRSKGQKFMCRKIIDLLKQGNKTSLEISR